MSAPRGADARPGQPRPLLIAHRGASGYRPEHTLAAYRLAVEQGADFIEPDLVMTRDGVLVARHENQIGGTTDVAAHPAFASRRRHQLIDGVGVEGWFTEDFTFAELRTLRARERLPGLRAANCRYGGQEPVPSFAEILQLLAELNAARKTRGERPVGIYPEIKHPGHFAALRLAMEQPLLALLEAHAGAAPVCIQSFETWNLKLLATRCVYPLVQLVDLAAGPWDLCASGAVRSAAELLSDSGLDEIARYARVLGVHKQWVLPRDAMGALQPATDLVTRAHRAGLAVHAWTFRAENEFLPPALRRGTEPAAHGALEEEIRAHVAAGIDGLFCDQPDIARRALAPA
jgi:glycerophosphoryl diester phosphodiesterase